MRGKFYTSGRNGSNKVLYILPSVCFATFLAIARAKSSAAHAMSGHQKVANTNDHAQGERYRITK